MNYLVEYRWSDSPLFGEESTSQWIRQKEFTTLASACRYASQMISERPCHGRITDDDGDTVLEDNMLDLWH